MYLERTSVGEIPAAALARELLHCGGSLEVERFCDDDGDYKRKYNVYRLTANGNRVVLKKSDEREITIYRDFLQGRGFAVPEYLGSVEHEGVTWLLMEYIGGPDLRRFDRDMALACAGTLSAIQNAYWNSSMDGGRFQRYWERINRRAECLNDYPELAEAYKLFLARQKDCPRTLCSGDFLQCNGIWHGGRAYMIDWGFGGVMPYALDIARLIAHGSEKPETYAFPFYMDGPLRSAFVRTHYERLEHKPDWERYIMDIKLAALNEYVEFMEALINDPEISREEIEEDFTCRRARETAASIL
ncbi:MAG: aminoglycoside phosphotransferase family protein [Oscillospiraceae bacterium]|nr:aminoglycoside phosphotransferase family protein [Oscillospiraceae bacterium]